MNDPRRARISALLERVGSEHLDGLLVTSLPNIRYLTGFTGTNALLLVTPAEVHLLTDSRYLTQAEEEVAEVAAVRVEQRSLWDGVWTVLSGRQSQGVFGFESLHVVHRDFRRLMEEGARWQWRATTDLVEQLRQRKDAAEVAEIERAAQMACAALESVIANIRPGMTELALAGELERALREQGSEAFPFPTIVASGARSALPHARSGGRELARGELLLLDFGAVAGGYCADVSRTFVVGRSSSEQREIHAIVREANEIACRGIRAGMTGKDADLMARSYIEGRGHGGSFSHSLGHGLGLEVHESPRLSRTADAALPTGAVVTVEPGIYRPGWGGVRIEDSVHLDAGGPRVLTRFTRELLELA